jgi:hypothetical protein
MLWSKCRSAKVAHLEKLVKIERCKCGRTRKQDAHFLRLLRLICLGTVWEGSNGSPNWQVHNAANGTNTLGTWLSDFSRMGKITLLEYLVFDYRLFTPVRGSGIF